MELRFALVGKKKSQISWTVFTSDNKYSVELKIHICQPSWIQPHTIEPQSSGNVVLTATSRNTVQGGYKVNGHALSNESLAYIHLR